MDTSTIYVVGTGAAVLVEVCQCIGTYTGIKITALITYHNNDCSLCFQTFSSTSQEVIHIEYVAMIQKNEESISIFSSNSIDVRFSAAEVDDSNAASV